MSLVQMVDNQEQPVASSHLCLHELLTRQAALTPEVSAVVEGTNSLTYRALEARANQLARSLRALGVGPEQVVGLALEPGRDQLETLVGLFGILKAGGAVLTLSSYYPPAQLRWVMQDAQVGLIVAVSHSEGRRMEESSLKHRQIVCLDDPAMQEQVAAHPLTPPQSGVGIHNLAYVIYTSGSTGNPKGVLCEHVHLGPLGAAQGALYEVKVGDRIGHAFNWQFDGIWSVIATALANGATLCLPEQGVLDHGARTVAWVERERISLLFCTPSYLASWPEITLSPHPAMVVAGESCPEDLARRYAARCRFYTAYGPAEAGICLTTGLYSGQGTPSLGRPLPYVRLALLDAEGHLVPPGAEGEVVVWHPQARAYTNPSETEQRFRSAPKGREYHTGDFARQLPDGSLLFAGRKDTQGKFPGGLLFNTEQVEQLLGAHPQVHTCVALWRAERWAVAYVQLKHPRALPMRNLRTYLASLLPQKIAVHCLCVEVEQLALMPNGKIDRNPDHYPLPTASDTGAYDEVFQAPVTALETALAELVAELTGSPFSPADAAAINVLATLPELGLDSLTLGTLEVRVAEQWHRGLTQEQAFTWPLYRLAAALAEQPAPFPVLEERL